MWSAGFYHEISRLLENLKGILDSLKRRKEGIGFIALLAAVYKKFNHKNGLKKDQDCIYL